MNKLLSKNILKQSVKNSWKLWTILTSVLCFFITVITIVLSTREGMPMPGPGAGGDPLKVTGDGILSLYNMMFFGSMAMGTLFLLIYCITIGNKLVASEIDKGTMSFMLNTPTTRKQIIFSKALFYIISITLMIVLIGFFGTITSLSVGFNINVGKLWLVILGFLLFIFATSGICFFASCWFNKSGNSILVGAGLPVAFLLLNTFSDMISELEFLKYFSLNTLFDTSAIMSGSGFIIQFIAMFIIGIMLYTVGINKFLKKDLPL